MSAEIFTTISSSILVLIAVLTTHLQTSARLDLVNTRIDQLGDRLGGRIERLDEDFVRHEHSGR